MKLDRFVRSAREAGPGWDADRAARVLDGLIVTQARRAARQRLARRGAVVLSGAALVFVLVQRLAAASVSIPEPLAAQDEPAFAGDGGYGRD